jgi:hypothetical protein
MSTKVQLIGGEYQDSEGNVLADGYLILRLNQDSVVNTSQVCAGIDIKIQLDSDGNVASSTSTPPAPDQFVWGNDQLTPINSFYKISGFANNGQPSWGPNNCQIIGDGGTFDMGTITPNTVFSWQPSVQGVTLKTNGVLNSTQTLLNLAGSGVSESGGTVTISSGGVGAGQSIFPRTPFLSSSFTSVSGGNKSLIYGLPAGSIAAFNGNFQIKFQVGANTLIVGGAKIERTLPNDTTIIDSAVITWGGSPTPSLAAGVHTSDSLAYIADSDHDYYIIVYFDPSNTTGTVYGGPANALYQCGAAVLGDARGNSISSLQGSLAQNAWYAITGIVTA